MKRHVKMTLTAGVFIALAGATAPAGLQIPQDSKTSHVGASVVAAWNTRAHDIAVAEDQFLTFKGQRALAMMHLAMHDALNSIIPVYERYTHTGPLQVAHPVAAVAQGAYEVLVSQYPDQQPALTAELAAWLERVPQGALRERGVELGREAAAAILARRSGDGFDFPGEYEFQSGPGQYQTTPPWNGFVAQPGFRFAEPFVLAFQSRFRPPPPPPLSSRAYAKAFREVKEYGALDSTRRTEDQTAYAVWWMEFAEGSVNRLARQLTVGRELDLWSAARVFAQIGVALFDTYVAVWDSKYEYNHWRPYTAIRAAQTDGNPRTGPDPAWEPLRPTPPFPEYVSAHAAACAASFGVLERTFGHNVQFTMETTTAPPGMPTRTFDSFDAAVRECADSRVRLGWHFRYATNAGVVLGRKIANHTAKRALRKLIREELDRD
jgi:PAP2 superfamily